MNQRRILSLGSVNLDFQVRADRWPGSGETLLAQDFLMASGGKAANVAYLARQLGAEVQLIARVGDDDLAEHALQPLRHLSIDLQYVRRVPGSATAVSMIVVQPSADSNIGLANNANDAWTASDAEDAAAAIAAAPARSVLVTDFEIPVHVVRQAVQAASEHGHTVIVDPSPSDRVNLSLFPYIDYLTPNAGEASRLTGHAVESVDDAFAAAASLHARGARIVLVKLSVGGCIVFGSDIQEHVTSTGVQPVDSTGAGDAFAGALSVAVLEGQSLLQAARFAVAAADHAVTQYGSQASYPTRAALEHRLNA